jgi:hypothetical protein
MIVATFKEGTALAGKNVTFEEGQLALEGALPLTPQQVLDFDGKGEIEWAYDGLRQWLRELALHEQPTAAPPAILPVPQAAAPAAAVTFAAPKAEDAIAPAPVAAFEPTAQTPKKKSHFRSAVLAGIALIVAIIVVSLVIQAFAHSGKPSATSNAGLTAPVAVTTDTASAAPEPTPTPTPPMTKAAYMQRMTADRTKLLKELRVATAAGAAGNLGANAFDALGTHAQDMASSWAALIPPKSLKTTNGLWMHALRVTNDLGTPQSSDLRGMRHATGACLAAIEKTGGLANSGLCSSITANLSRGLWVESASAAFMSACHSVSYPVLNKDAGSMKGRKLVIHGQVFQIQDAGSGQFWDGYPDGITPRTTMLVSVTDEGYGMWTDNVDVAFDGALKKVYENNIVTVYGTCVGQFSYTSVAGYDETVPLIHAKYVTK